MIIEVKLHRVLGFLKCQVIISRNEYIDGEFGVISGKIEHFKFYIKEQARSEFIHSNKKTS
jgi:hypothetical protein